MSETEKRTTPGAATLEAKLKLLSGLSLFHGISEAALADVAKAAKPHSWSANTMLFQRGDASNYLIAMERGHIRISLQTRSGREFVLQHVRGAATVGEIGSLDGSTRTADATAAAPTHGYVIDRASYAMLRNRHPDLAQAAIRHLCGLVRYTTDHIETIALYGLKARVARFLLSAARQHDAEEARPRPAFDLDLNQSEIADLLGSSRPKLNQTLAALEQTGAITRRGKSIVCDREMLLRFAALSDED